LLVFQIAAGIVLAVLILRYWSELFQWTLQAGTVLAVIAAICGTVLVIGWLYHLYPEATATVFFLGCLMASIKYGARGIGYGYIKCMPYLKRSPRLRRAASLLGAREAWAFADRVDKEFIDAVGDTLFIQIPFRIFFTFIGISLATLGIVSGAQAVKLAHTPNPALILGAITACGILFAAGATAWCFSAQPGQQDRDRQ
jgi:hypothetical protein